MLGSEETQSVRSLINFRDRADIAELEDTHRCASASVLFDKEHN